MLTVWYVYEEDKRIAGPYMAQAPATSFAASYTRPRSWSPPNRKPLQVIEETYELAESKKVRTVIDGKIFKEPKCS